MKTLKDLEEKSLEDYFVESNDLRQSAIEDILELQKEIEKNIELCKEDGHIDDYGHEILLCKRLDQNARNSAKIDYIKQKFNITDDEILMSKEPVEIARELVKIPEIEKAIRELAKDE